MINHQTFGNVKNILIGQDSFHIALPIKLTGSANAVIKAGEVLTGDLTARLSTEFSVSTSSPVGLLLHEVKLDENGKGNGTIVVAGCIDLLKLDSTVVSNIKTAIANLPNIIITEGSAI